MWALAAWGALAVRVPDVAWRRAYDFAPSESHPHAGVQMADGGFLMVGDGLDFTNQNPKIQRYVYVLRTDAQGQERWRLTLGTAGWNYGKFGLELADGSFVVAGGFTANGTLHRGLVHISAAGAVLAGPQLLPVAQAGRQECFVGLALAEDGALVATGFVNAWPGYPDEAMFLVYGQVGLTKLTLKNGGFGVVFDTVLDTTGQPFSGSQGMKVLYDAKAQQYVASHTVIMDGGVPGAFEFGLSAFTLAGQLKWTRAFPSGSAGFPNRTASHPYALALGLDGTYAIGGLAVDNDCEGRLVSVAPSGDLRFDRRFRSAPGYNVECYGVQPTHDGGYILTCGAGVKSADAHPNATAVDLTWRALVHRTDAAGQPLWDANYGNRSTRLSNAGEFIVATGDGGYAVYVDSKAWGDPGLGGSFALLRLGPDADTSLIV